MPLHGQSAAGQSPSIVAKIVALSSGEATLTLELLDAPSVEIGLVDGVVVVDGEDIGRFEPGGSLDEAWRRLLSRAVELDGQALLELLIDFEAPEDTSSGERASGEQIDRTLDARLGTGPLPPSEARFESLELRRLLENSERLVGLGEALEGLALVTDRTQVRIGEDLTIDAGSEFEGTLIVVDADLTVEGIVRGDVVVVDGTMRLVGQGRVTGDVRLVDAQLQFRESRVGGTVVDLDSVRRERDRELREQIRGELDSESASRSLEQQSRSSSSGSGIFSRTARRVGSVFGRLWKDLVNLLLMGMLGGATLFFFRENLEVIAETARRDPLRAGGVGVAGAVLAGPIYALGTIALLISLVGIPVLFVWLPLFPLAIFVSLGLGFFAVAMNIGEWIARGRYRYLEWVRLSNPYTLVMGGLIGIAAPFLLADALRLFGSLFGLGLLRSLLGFAGLSICAASVFVGFGAVILTRAGRQPEFYPVDTLDGEEWSEAAAAGDEDDWFGRSDDAHDDADAADDEGEGNSEEQDSGDKS